MPHYELIYENGEHSIAFYEDDDEARSAIDAHVERAKTGQPATAVSTSRPDIDVALPVEQQTWSAQRIVKVLVYDKHPNDYGEDASNLTVDVATPAVADLIKETADENGVVNVQELAAALLETTAPRIADSPPHESNYKMKSVRELKVGAN